MPEAWRIIKAQHAVSAFSGRGAADYGGRWNSRSVAVVYASQAKSLAVLESLVHLNPPVPFRYTAFHLEFPAACMERFPLAQLPTDWRTEPPPPATQQIGDQWVRAARSAVLALPSVIIPSEANYMLNPAHPDFTKIIISPAEPFAFDPRLLNRR